MKTWQRLAPCLFGLVWFVSLASAQTASAYDSVHPIIGTDGGGNTFPGASLPFGMIQWSPDTGSDAWYHYTDRRIYGFSLTHISGAGCPVYGDIPVLPFEGELTVSPHQNRERYTQPFDHTREAAHPGYYALTLANGVEVEITVTARAGIARFLFPQGMPARLLLNAGGSANSIIIDRKPGDAARANDSYRIRIDGAHGVQGQARSGAFCDSPTRYAVYFSAQFEQPFVRTAMWHDDTVEADAHEEDARHAGAWLDFGNQRVVVMKVGLSFVSAANARANLENEIPEWDFDAVHRAAAQTWSRLFDCIEIRGGTPAQRTIFYTALYHMLLSPNLFSDGNGEYIGFDNKVHTFAGTKQLAQYANFSDWDIYRDVIQLQALLDPARVSDMAQSLVNDAKQSGWLSRWPYANDNPYVMAGDSSAILLADAYAFGARNFDTQGALAAMVKGATQLGDGLHGQAERLYLADVLKLGYVPSDRDTISASRTLEYASADFAIAQFVHGLNLRSSFLETTFLKRAGNWEHIFDPQTKWIRPRNADGSWLQGFDPERSMPKRTDRPGTSDQAGFEEGNTWQYSFMIPFDYPRLIREMGGSAAVVPRLDRFFSKLICWGEPCFNMANEPDFVVPYAYEYTDHPWKTDDVVTRIEQQTFGTKQDGIPGNDDLGATSGVYLWNALGLYPGVPGVGGFFVGTPMFPEATLHLSGGRTVSITSEGTGVYVRYITLNGQPYRSLWLPLDRLPANATTRLHFTLQPDEPASADFDAPPTFRP